MRVQYNDLLDAPVDLFPQAVRLYQAPNTLGSIGVVYRIC